MPYLSSRTAAPSIPPTLLVLLAVGSVQLGSGVATHLFAEIGPGGAAFLRVAYAAPILLVLWRPRLRGYSRADYAFAAAFGLTIAAMNFVFYSSLNRIPLGIAVTLEFVGPLGVAVAGSRRPLDLVWVALAAGGVVLLAPWGGLTLDPLGAGLALLSGGFWALYILLSARVGRSFPGGRGLALAMVVGTVALAPVGIVVAGAHLLDLGTLLLGLVVAVLSSIVPYSLELEALRRLPTRTFGVLMSCEPAVAALVGFFLLRQVLGPRAIAAVIMVVIAALGASQSSTETVRD